MSKPTFQSFFIGGFESSTHRTRQGRRLDLISATAHDKFAVQDYSRLHQFGVRTARDGVRWHLIEQSPGRYDFSSILPMLHAARETDIQVIWDLCHYGWPDYLDIFKPEFVRCFAAFARAFAHLLNEETDAVPFISPVNEISFFAWASGEVGYFFPYVEGRGMELKAQLVHATIEGIEAVWNILPRTRIVHADPMINVVASPQRSYESEAAEAYRLAQYEAWDMLAGRMKPELGGAEKYLDCLGINYYPHNQWFVHKPSYNPAHALPRTHPLYKPFRRILQETYERYRRPVFIAETGSEGKARVEWLDYIGGEVRAAIKVGVPVEGICLYPIVNHPGWDDDRHCHNGLWDYADEHGQREVYEPLARELRRQQEMFEGLRCSSSEDSLTQLEHGKDCSRSLLCDRHHDNAENRQ